MTNVDELARELVTLLLPGASAGQLGPEHFGKLHRIIFDLRHLPLSLLAANEDPEQLSDLPPREALLLLKLVRIGGPREAGIALFCASVEAIADDGDRSE